MKLGDLLYVKSSEEPVLVLALEGVIDHPEAKVEVRRPIMGKDGTRYEPAWFFRFELETHEEQTIRKLEDIKRTHRLTQLAQKEIPVTPQFDFSQVIDPNASRN